MNCTTSNTINSTTESSPALASQNAWKEQTALLLSFATHLGLPRFTSASDTDSRDNLAVLLQRQTLTTVKGLTIEVPGLHILAHDRQQQSLRQNEERIFTSRSLQLSVNTVDAAPSLLQNSVLVAFRSAINCCLKGWIHMLRRFLIAKHAEERAAWKNDKARHAGKNATCKEAKVLRALHSIAFSIQVERVQTSLRVRRDDELSRLGACEQEEEKKVEGEVEFVTPEVEVHQDESSNEHTIMLFRIPLVFEARVYLCIMGQKNCVLINAPASIVGTFYGHKAAALQGMKVEINESLLRSSILQQARLVVRQAAALKMIPNNKILLQTAITERPSTPMTNESGNSLDSDKVTTTLMPPPAPLPLVSPTVSEWHTRINDAVLNRNLVCPSLLSVPIVRKVSSGTVNQDDRNSSISNTLEKSEPICVSPTTSLHEHSSTMTCTRLTKKQKLYSIPSLKLGGW